MASFLDHVHAIFGSKFPSTHQKYGPVLGNEGEKEIDYAPQERYCNRETVLKISLVANGIGAVFIVLFSVIAFMHGFHAPAASQWKGDVMTSQLLADQYGLPGRIPVTYELLQHGLDEDDFVAANSYWADLFPRGGGLVLLPDETVDTLRLPPTMKVSSVGNRSLYEMAGYHSLHCLTSVRAVIAGFVKAQKNGRPYLMNDDGWNHLKHCLADARENILCNLDETLLVVPAGKHPGDGQTKLCKQLGPINKWLEDNYRDFDL